LFINLTPFIPLSLKGEGEEILERGFAPLLSTLPLPLIREGGQGDRLLNNFNMVILHIKPDCDIILVKNKGYLRWVYSHFFVMRENNRIGGFIPR